MSQQNKKICNATTKEVDGIHFKSLLEVSVYKTLTSAGFKPEYEPTKYTIVKGFIPKTPFYTKGSNGMLKLNDSKVIDITYTPDFVFDYKGIKVFVEVKGFENDVFPVKKKLFRAWLDKQTEFKALFFEVWNKRQTLQAIEIIKDAPKYMSKIDDIRALLPNLPTKKDVELAEKFLNERKFIELKELVDSDAIKVGKERLKIEEKIDSPEHTSEEYVKVEETYNNIKELQSLIEPIAKDFMDPLQNSEEEEEEID